ncbi:MAG: hypothetical protein HYY84_04805 [Deltaproteobacteria bacterium]|nr:hypothetical protein [Deltaproteobacteria bacterium]
MRFHIDNRIVNPSVAWRAAAIALLVVAGCRAEGSSGRIVVHASEALHAGVKLAVDDLVADFGRISGRAVERVAGPAARCVRGESHIEVQGIVPEREGGEALHAQAYEIAEERCGDGGRRVMLRGGGLLSAQWAVYDLLQRLGVRYFHPEQTVYPKVIAWPAEPIRVVERPAFQQRYLHAHRTHPIELVAPLGAHGLDMAGYQRRWIDWNVKMRQSSVDGTDETYIGDYRNVRGFPWGGGLNLLNAQQGGRPLLSPDDRRPESQQIAEAIDRQMRPRDGFPPPSSFGFQFNANEFTPVDDVKTVERIRFITDYVSSKYPGVDIYTINHGTAMAPTPNFGVRFFDLSQFASGNLGVKVHTLMFYDLERAAPVYGNTDFSHMLAWLRREAGKRRIVHYPESSWWLTFDLPVPLFLAPATLEARQHDIDLVRDLVVSDPKSKTGVYGHELFSSGQEWGYWLIDYCVAQMAWDLSMTHARCLDDFFATIEGGDEVRAVWREVEARQVVDMRDTEIVRFLVGSDDATETALKAGINFHPLPPAPGDVLAWDDAKVAELERRSLAPLRTMAADYARWTARIDAILERQSASQASWVREIRDGLKVFGLRAAHAVAVYETSVALRAALKARDDAAVQAAKAGLLRARAVTEDATGVIRAREADYRYPAALTIEGDEAGTPGALQNPTVYPYRYLSRTHRAFYWTRPDAQLAALFEPRPAGVTSEKGVVRVGAPFDLTVTADGISRVEVDWGDGTTPDAATQHAFSRQGFFTWRAAVDHARGRIDASGVVAAVAERVVVAKGALAIVEPAGASAIGSSLPGFEVGLGDDGASFMAVRPLERGVAVERRARTGTTSAADDLALPLGANGSVTIFGATLEVADADAAGARKVTVRGKLSTDEIVALLVRVGGFDAVGAKRTIALLLGYTPETLPAQIDVVAEGPGRAED